MKIFIQIEWNRPYRFTSARAWANRIALGVALLLVTSPLWLLAVAVVKGVPA
ncbi:hypothetical protein [Chromobacterium amazonense]|uniref:hypothetical protein n=1 Tax=Chromobacterium amazonense TaxID=1382803 RepID=UPI0016705B43|nr:hypothetical protein [Chromobacterium amazonense]